MGVRMGKAYLRVRACVRACVRSNGSMAALLEVERGAHRYRAEASDHSRDELFRREIVEAEEPALARAIVGAAGRPIGRLQEAPNT